MEAYSDFASVYDTFMDNTPYAEWCDYLVSLLQKEGVKQGIVLDLGCGTGTLTQMLARKGYDMIGIDNAEAMLQIATDKKEEKDKILYLCQDMREFELYGTVAAAMCVCDSINYITEYGDLVKVFRHVNLYLDPNGIFIFDFNTEYKYKEIIGDTIIAENREDCSFIWENYYYAEEKINEYDLTIFLQDDASDLFRKFTETHYQRGYTLEEIRVALREAGLCFIAAYDGDTHAEVSGESERIYIVAREQGKSI